MADYTSKYFSCEEIDQRMKQGWYDDIVKKGYTGTKDEFDEMLSGGIPKVVQEEGSGPGSENRVMSQKATTLKLSELDMKSREYSSPIYPFASSTDADKYAPSIVEIYVKDKYAANGVALTTIRRNQTGKDWEGERTEVKIVSLLDNSTLFVSTRFNHDDNNSREFLGNNNVSIIIDWSKIEKGTGYGFTSDRYRLLDSVFNIDNSPCIKNYIYTTNVETSISQPDGNIEFDFSQNVVNASINSDNSLNEYGSYRSIHNAVLPEGAQSIYIKNLIDTKSNLRLIQLDDSGGIIANTYHSDYSNKFVILNTKTKRISLGLISGSYDGSYGTNLSVLVDEILRNIYILGVNYFGKKNINGIPIVSSDIEAITGIKINGTLAPKEGTQVSLENATSEKGGLMSSSDKRKLDNIIEQGSITINGSGLYKNASNFGFLPTNTAEKNAIALQNALNGGGTVIVDLPGTYSLCNTIYIDSNTTIYFGAGVYISKEMNNEGKKAAYTFINRGAFNREYNENIKILGLHLICNGLGMGDDVDRIQGLRGQIAFFYIKNLIIDGFTLLDGEAGSYVIHICRFENIQVLNTHIEGLKDAIHLGVGNKYVIRNGWFKTFDDPIALNAHDYPSGQPEYGWIENGIIENCYDLADPDVGTTGYFARILAGSWSKWNSGNKYQKNGDTCVSNGRIYKTVGDALTGTEELVSNEQPTHTEGQQTYSDGLTWYMMQVGDITTCGVRNVTFRNIYLQKPRNTALSIHFDKNGYSRSYYPNSESPIQENILFDGVYMQAEAPIIINAVTPINNIKIINSNLRETKINLTSIGTEGIRYTNTHILMIGNTFSSEKGHVIASSNNRNSDIKIVGSIRESSAVYTLDNVTNLGCDIVN